jgi:hypothetical protein
MEEDFLVACKLSVGNMLAAEEALYDSEIFAIELTTIKLLFADIVNNQ